MPPACLSRFAVGVCFSCLPLSVSLSLVSLGFLMVSSSSARRLIRLIVSSPCSSTRGAGRGRLVFDLVACSLVRSISLLWRACFVSPAWLMAWCSVPCAVHPSSGFSAVLAVIAFDGMADAVLSSPRSSPLLSCPHFYRPTPSCRFSRACLFDLVPRPRALDARAGCRFAAAGVAAVCLLAFLRCRSFTHARSLSAGRVCFVACCAVFVEPERCGLSCLLGCRIVILSIRDVISVTVRVRALIACCCARSSAFLSFPCFDACIAASGFLYPFICPMLPPFFRRALPRSPVFADGGRGKVFFHAYLSCDELAKTARGGDARSIASVLFCLGASAMRCALFRPCLCLLAFSVMSRRSLAYRLPSLFSLAICVPPCRFYHAVSSS